MDMEVSIVWMFTVCLDTKMNFYSSSAINLIDDTYYYYCLNINVARTRAFFWLSRREHSWWTNATQAHCGRQARIIWIKKGGVIKDNENKHNNAAYHQIFPKELSKALAAVYHLPF